MSPDEIRVKVIDRGGGRGNLVYRWKSESTSGERSVARAVGVKGTNRTARRAAERAIPQFVEALARELGLGSITWRIFRQRYEREKPWAKPKTLKAWVSAANAFERTVAPKSLIDLNADSISRFQAAMRDRVAPASVDAYLRSLRAAARWAGRVFPDYVAPEIRTGKPRSAGRPLSGEEFDRLLKAVPDIMGEYAADWDFLLKGLVSSGLRLGQALQLSWDSDAPIRVLMRAKPLIVIGAEAHKGGRDETVPTIPHFAELLQTIAPGARVGRVFRLRTRRGPTTSLESASEIIRKIGGEKGARIVVGTRRKRVEGEWAEVPKYASAHDLKRTFVQRCHLAGVPMAITAKLAQHQSVETTQRHYSEHDAERLSEQIWEIYRRNDNAETAWSES